MQNAPTAVSISCGSNRWPWFLQENLASRKQILERRRQRNCNCVGCDVHIKPRQPCVRTLGAAKNQEKSVWSTPDKRLIGVSSGVIAVAIYLCLSKLMLAQAHDIFHNHQYRSFNRRRLHCTRLCRPPSPKGRFPKQISNKDTNKQHIKKWMYILYPIWNVNIFYTNAT